MFAVNPYQQYKDQSLSTLASGELLVKLYEELIKQMHLACINIEENDIGYATPAINKAQLIISTMESSLDMQYELSQNLRELYIFIAKQILKAEQEKDSQPIKECIPLVRNLRDAFEEAEKTQRKQQAHIGGKAV